ncbi:MULTISPECIES: hypothetical protein [Snodgrassella]|uniref:hypothetical protein n=1 Tax=Snodgrassella TaxID=1193515 RepID=UPI000A01AE34|nr:MULTISPECIES: hypothetical protein [Snodgrassella]MBI0129949.1 hypothetical protein [Snodgrassella sp. W8124]NUE80092.1 hypothetical protein [Snodgrassella sp. ESL0304]ORF28188.1 hypothetical protein BGI08_05635 [Snodgrassella alvi]ORF36993.1 hypothetical protein BGI12_05835 [Snodgrassella alvi]
MSKNPVLIPQAFAANGSKNNIQNTRQTGQDPEDATWSDGFPNVTMQPIESGGLPPKGMDFNGILNALSATIVHMQKGNLFYFDKPIAMLLAGIRKVRYCWLMMVRKYLSQLQIRTPTTLIRIPNTGRLLPA